VRHLKNWDDDEKKRDRWEKQKEKLGRYMFVGSTSVLVVYLGTVFLEMYLKLLIFILKN